MIGVARKPMLEASKLLNLPTRAMQKVYVPQKHISKPKLFMCWIAFNIAIWGGPVYLLTHLKYYRQGREHYEKTHGGWF